LFDLFPDLIDARNTRVFVVFFGSFFGRKHIHSVLRGSRQAGKTITVQKSCKMAFSEKSHKHPEAMGSQGTRTIRL
jgi:hypothetical protein